METKEELMKENRALAPVLVIGGIILLLCISYATYSIVNAASGTNIVKNGCFETIYEEGSNIINMNNLIPVSDEEGLTANAYTFTIDNTCSRNSSYEIVLAIENSNIPLSDLKLSINNDKPVNFLDLESRKLSEGSYIETKKLKYGSLTTGENATYSLKLWIDQDSKIDNAENKTISAKVLVNNYDSE